MTDTTTPALPDDLAQFSDNLLRQCRANLADNREITTHAFVLQRGAHTYEQIELDAANEREKDIAALVVRQVARDTGADAVIVVAEAWGLADADLPRYDAIRAQYGSLEAYPGHLDVLLLSVETPGCTWLGQAPIEHQQRGRSLGPINYVVAHPGAATFRGRYMGFLQPAQAPAPGTLH